MKKYLFLNWKNYLSLQESYDLAEQLSGVHVNPDSVELVTFPTIAAVTDIQQKGVECGVQYFDEHKEGAFTGETTFNIVKDLGVKYVLVGHSERRILFHESDEDVAAKVDLLVAAGMVPIICVGENKQQKDHGKTKEVIQQQLQIATKSINLKKVIIAYEPIWAISGFGGTEPATIDDIVSVCQYIHTQCNGHDVPVLYGGSVHADIEDAIINNDNIQGFLVGKASTDFQEVCVLYQRLLASLENKS